MNNFFFKKENFVLDKDFTFSLLKKFDEIFMSKKYKKNLENIREIDQNNICNEPLFKKTLDIIYEKFQLITSFNDLEFSKLWLVYSKSNDTNKNILPYVPHIDKKRFLNLIERAFICGANLVKIQTYEPVDITLKKKNKKFKITSGTWKNRYLWDLYKEAYTPFNWHNDAFKVAFT